MNDLNRWAPGSLQARRYSLHRYAHVRPQQYPWWYPASVQSGEGIGFAVDRLMEAVLPSKKQKMLEFANEYR